MTPQPRGVRGSGLGRRDDVLSGADVLIGLSGPGAVTATGVRRMPAGAIVFAMARGEARGAATVARDDAPLLARQRTWPLRRHARGGDRRNEAALTDRLLHRRQPDA
jgi:hypothetical protein